MLPVGIIVTGVLLFLLAFFVLGVIKLFGRLDFDAPQKEEALPYKLKKYFFTRSEREFFHILKDTIDTSRYAIFPKVRIGDYIQPINHGRERWGSWNRIKSRHVDFIVWELQQGKVVLAIEVDGSSHRTNTAAETDGFKNQLFHAVGLKLIRVRVGTDFHSAAKQVADMLGTPTSPDPQN